ncbi:MAG: SDR family oxidoreductase [Eubacteriales bacterium]
MILITGGTGFVGRHLVRALSESGRRVRCLVRGLKPGLFPPEVEQVEGDVTRPGTLREAVAGASGVIHLVAVIREKGDSSFRKVNVEGARNMVAAARSAGARRFIHVSALGAINDPAFSYAYSKWQAEEAVRGSSLDWTIFRPSLIYGRGFGFFDRQIQSLKMSPPPFAPVPGAGRALFQPIAVEDLVRCLLLSLDDLSFYRRIVEVGGPEHLSYARMLDILMETLGQKRIKVPVPLALMRLAVPIMGVLLRDPPVTPAELKQLELNNITEASAVEKLFGFKPRPLSQGIKYLAG